MDEHLDASAIHEIEDIVGTKIYPGTEIMRDVGSHHFLRAGGETGEGQTQSKCRVLVPQPNDDPNDPLNWTPLWKSLTIFAVTTFTLCMNLGPLACAPMFNSYMAEWNKSLGDVVQFTGIVVLVMGFSNFLWVPLIVKFGRRPVAIIGATLCAASAIWRAKSNSYGSFIGACVLNGLGAGPSEPMMPQVIADIAFLHDRGKYQTLYYSTYFISLMVGPIISGAMDYQAGWRSFWWLNLGISVFSLVVLIFCFPETRYDRVAVQAAGVTASSASDAITNDDVSRPETTTSTGKGNILGGNTNGLGQGAPAEIEQIEQLNDDSRRTSGDKAMGSDTVGADAKSGLDSQHVDRYLGISKPSRARFGFYLRDEPHIRSTRSFRRELWLPFYLFTFPIVEFAAVGVAWSASNFLVANLTQAQAFSAPPYNYSSQTIGLFNLAIFIGAAIGLLTCGPFSDMTAAWLTRRNNGIREPEFRLLAMVPYVCCLVVGSTVVAVGYHQYWKWQIIVIVGYTLLGVQVAGLPSIVSTYAIDSYRPVTGSIFIPVVVYKNGWAYAMSWFLTPWIEKAGYLTPIMANMGIALFFCSMAIPLWFWGKNLRGVTSKSFVHKL
ncbi:hypothetical protein SBRCBS47491_006367 [Sporothrix bragantina]|uniref:Major facilitator superfamily (MFS) profile domain-containing protein n=1 Tax=Sporothrix bragantina TaxID=671064 RepID=A0ABP0C4V3_9PEZI